MVTEPEEPAPQNAAAPCQPGLLKGHTNQPKALGTSKTKESCGHLLIGKILSNEAGLAGELQLVDDGQADESAPDAAADWSAEALQWKQRCKGLENQVMQLEYKLAMAEMRQTVRCLLQRESDAVKVLLSLAHRTSALII